MLSVSTLLFPGQSPEYVISSEGSYSINNLLPSYNFMGYYFCGELLF